MNIDLVSELKKAFNGDAWHGDCLMNQLNKVKPEQAFEYFIPDAHSIAEIVLHITSWTLEVADRIKGEKAKAPEMGDWPEAGNFTVENWKAIVAGCIAANEKLIEVCEQLDGNDTAFQEERDRALGSGVSRAELLNGIIQHHAYHSGQLALLIKFDPAST
ncbi:hypothetical protein D9M68_843840 [compost metagenome]